ncbi:MAG: aminoglycoside phosphotransferase family protein [Dehalococcoidia bacterium]|nr:aminoglycoside phosphotransferase family protein [Dehalococcoidia bacterium]
MLPPAVRQALDASGVRPSRVTLLGSGSGSLAYRVASPGGPLVVRVVRPEAAHMTGDLRRDVLLTPILETRGLPVARGMRPLLEERGAIVATVHAFVPGDAAFPLPRGRARDALAVALGRFLAALHRTPRSIARRARVPSLDLWAGRYAAWIAEARELMPPRSRAWLDALSQRFVDAGGTEAAPRVLVHGDLGARHVVVDRAGRLAGILDFGDAMVADAAIDVAALRQSYPRAFVEGVIEAYECAGGTLDRDAWRRATFYLDVEPLWAIRFGAAFDEGRGRTEGLRQIAARAAAATRRTPGGRA